MISQALGQHFENNFQENTIEGFKSKIAKLLVSLDGDSEACKSLKEYSARVEKTLFAESLDIQNDPKVKNAVDTQTDIVASRLGLSALKHTTQVAEAGWTAANDENFLDNQEAAA